ncbi:MAG: DUF945 family protein [Burkholderiaceae bacterium]
MLRTALVTGLAGLCTVAAGATYYSAHSTRSALDSMLHSKELTSGAVRLVEKSRETSLLSTHGTMAVQFDASCLNPESPMVDVPVLLDYSFDHRPGIDGLSRLKLTLALTDEADEKVREAVGARPLLELHGNVDFAGRLQATFSTPEVTAQAPDGTDSVKIAASSGEIQQLSSEVAIAWRLPSIGGTSKQGRFELKQFTVAGHYTDPVAGFGKQTIGLESVDVSDRRGRSQMQLRDLRIDQEQSLENGMINISTTPSIARVSVADQTFEDLGMRVAVERIDSNAFTRLQALSRTDCQQAMTDEHLKSLEGALFDLVERGMRLNIDQIRGRRGQDSFDGRMLFTLAPADKGTPTLLERTRVELAANVSAAMVPEEVVEPMTAQGLITASADKLSTELTLADGRLRINGTPGPAHFDQQVQGMLAMGESGMSGWREQVLAGQAPLASMTSQLLRQARGS